MALEFHLAEVASGTVCETVFVSTSGVFDLGECIEEALSGKEEGVGP